MYLILAISNLRENTVFIIPQSSQGIYMSEETRLSYTDKETDGVMIDLSKIAEQTQAQNINLALKFLPKLLIMTQITYKVEAFWDAEAEVWVATSEDIPGLVTETSTIDILTEKLRVMIPELLVLNQIVPHNYAGTINFELISHRQELIQVA